MSLQETASADRIHIAFFGKRNAGKSSLLNAVTGQNLSVVSAVAGTTTDPVKKAMELLPLGPVLLIDTPGFDDSGDLGTLRVEKTREILAKTHIAVLVLGAADPDQGETEYLRLIREKQLPCILVHNKSDLLATVPQNGENEVWVSAATGAGIEALKERLGALAQLCKNDRRIVADLLNPGDLVLLVTPIDASAPKGRLILPQQQTLRDILDAGCIAAVCQPGEVAKTLENLKTPPRLVITDSQAFGEVAKLMPESVPLTSFSILLARYKGGLPLQIKGAAMLSRLQDGDKVLISEGCTHHRQCGDIGTVKMPRWIQAFCGAKPDFTFTSGGEFPTDLKDYRLVVHCGGCMLNEAEMKHRLLTAKGAGVPTVNYGIAIAHMNGILRRSLSLFPELLSLLDTKA